MRHAPCLRPHPLAAVRATAICCDDAGHVTNFNDPDFLQSILSDLSKFKFQLRKSVAPATVVDSLELVCGNGYSLEKVAQTVNAGWLTDPVHPNKHIYAKTALNLMEKMANSRPASTGTGLPQSRANMEHEQRERPRQLWHLREGRWMCRRRRQCQRRQ
jgi:hypothetical protein